MRLPTMPFLRRLTVALLSLVALVVLVAITNRFAPRLLPEGDRWLSAAEAAQPAARAEADPPVTPQAPATLAPAATAPPLDGEAGRDLTIDRFKPRSMLWVTETSVPRAKFPAVDVHVHMRIKARHLPEQLEDYVKTMDEQNVAVSVSLDGQLGEALDEHLKYLAPHRDRFVVFANIDWRGDGKRDDPATWDCHRDDFGHRMALALADAKRRGASGLKIFKDFGLVYRNPDGSLIAIDDRRWDPIWEACGKLGLPILIHSADPLAFFQPIDARNERWDELRRHPSWSFYGPQFPQHADLLAALLRVVKRHRGTTFIGAHVASNAEDLTTVGRWLDEHPNLYVELAARLAEIGRQPFTAKRFLEKYADRVMFGTDGPRPRARLLPHWRVLETRDEYFPYAEPDQYPQGLWQVYGLGLPDDVLKKIYHDTAIRVIPGVKERWEKYAEKK